MTFLTSSTDGSTPRRESPSRVDEDDEPSLDTLQDRLGRGNEAAFERIFRRLSESVFRFVCGMVQDDALAHDITQDTFATLWEMRDRMDEVDALRPYVFQMARNRVYNQQRDAQTRRDHNEDLRELHESASLPSPAHDADASVLRTLLETWIDELPDRQQEALCLRRQEYLSHDEIAEVMDIAPSTVNNHIVRAMKHLRERLQEYRPDLLS